MAKLVYIIGVAHSGSTLLDLLTGTIDGVFSVGEATFLPADVHSRTTRCTCGKPFRECPAWQKIIANVSQKVGFDVFENPSRFRMALLQNPRWGKSIMDIYWALNTCTYGFTLRNRLFSPVSRLWPHIHAKTIDNNWLLFDTAAETCGIEYFTDSSKSLYRFKLLHSQRPNDIYALLLFRNIYATAYSAQKLNRNPLKTAKKAVRKYNNILSVLKNTPDLKYTFVKYENLCADPVAERRRIAHPPSHRRPMPRLGPVPSQSRRMSPRRTVLRHEPKMLWT